jgi:hypothetical protein
MGKIGFQQLAAPIINRMLVNAARSAFISRQETPEID